MKNKEKYVNEIAKCAIDSLLFAVNRNGEVVPCEYLSCKNCIFKTDDKNKDCFDKRKEWANSEYKEKKEFSNIDKWLVKGLDKLNWFARDKNGDVYGFGNRPSKNENCWNTDDGLLLWVNRYSSIAFEPLSWEDEEPTHRSEILEE